MGLKVYPKLTINVYYIVLSLIFQFFFQFYLRLSHKFLPSFNFFLSISLNQSLIYFFN
jgi:hypothetical protein